MRTILDLRKGESAVVERFDDASLSCKLLTMGVLPQSHITLVRKSPFGGAYYLKLNGLNVAVRKEEARTIILKDI